MSAKPLFYDGSNYFRQRLVLATLSGRSVKINRIRSHDDDPGLREFEASFIRLLDKVTNGSRIEVNEAGTGVLYQPGLLLGGNLDHDCNVQRGIGYYLEALICLAPFCKKPIKAVLRGVTSNQIDPSVDVIKSVSIEVMKRFGIDEGLELTVTKRGSPPHGGGEVTFTCPVRRNLRPIKLLKAGKVKKIRGVALYGRLLCLLLKVTFGRQGITKPFGFLVKTNNGLLDVVFDPGSLDRHNNFSTRVSPAFVNRMVEGARSVLNNFLTDIYIYTDHVKGPKSGKSPGFGISLHAETTERILYSAEAMSNQAGQEITVPEDLGKKAAQLLMEEIYRGGCIDSRHQSLALLFMALGQTDVSKLQTGPLSPYTIQFLRHMRDFLQVMFKVEADTSEEDENAEEGPSRTGGDKILLTCVGVGFSNLSKTIT